MAAWGGLFALLLVNLLLPTHHVHALFSGHAGAGHAEAGHAPLSIVVICTVEGVVEITWPASDELPEPSHVCPVCSLAERVAALTLPDATVLRLPWPIVVEVVAELAAPPAKQHQAAAWRARAPPIQA